MRHSTCLVVTALIGLAACSDKGTGVGTEQNPLIRSDAIATSAPFWLSQAELVELEKKALAGDAAAAFNISNHYAFTTTDRAAARKWLELAAKGGHEANQRSEAAYE